MMLTRFQTECPALYNNVLAKTKRLQHAHIGVEHVALVLLRDAASPLAAVLKQIGFDVATLIRLIGRSDATTSPSSNAPALPSVLSSPWIDAGAKIQPQTAIPVTFPTPTLDPCGPSRPHILKHLPLT